MRSSEDITQTIEEHADTVLRVCSLYFHGHPDREDAFQDTFLKYAQSATEFADSEHKKAWLIRVAANTCKDMLKRAESRIELVDEIDEKATPEWGGDAANDQAEQLASALRKLESPYRMALYLKYYEGYTGPEIAKMLDMPENTVYSDLARGREKLKEVLEHDS